MKVSYYRDRLGEVRRKCGEVKTCWVMLGEVGGGLVSLVEYRVMIGGS